MVRKPTAQSLPHLVLLGSGFAAFSLLKRIDTEAYRVTVVSPRNHFLFTPLLPSTTVGTIEFRSIIEPVRVARPEAEYYQATCTAIDFSGRTIECEGTYDARRFTLSYDLLVIAVGAAVNTYGIPGVHEHALFLKEVADARTIRQRIIECFENAAQPSTSEEERKRLLRFVVVGAGPTGIEFAAELHDFFTEDLKKSYASLIPLVRITVLEASDRILGTFDRMLAEYTLRLFQRQRIEVRTQSPVTRVDEKRIFLRDGSSVDYGLVVWSTGVAPSALVQRLPLQKDSLGRIVTDTFLRVKGVEDAFALGDCAVVENTPLPSTAQTAQQEGAYLARSLNRRARTKPVRPFRHRHYGMLAYVGSGKALADLPSVKARGFGTWLFWRSTYLTRLVSPKNKILVLFDWFKTFVFGRDISRF